MCGSFDTATFSGSHDMHIQHQQHSASRRLSETDGDDIDCDVPPGSQSQSMSHPFTPLHSRQSRRDSSASLPSPQVPCSSERTPLPPGRSMDMLFRRRSSNGRAFVSPSQGVAQSQGQLQESPTSRSGHPLQTSPAALPAKTSV